MDDLYNNLKVYESEIKVKSSLSSNSQNVALVSSNYSSSTNETVNTAHSVSTASSKDQASTASYVDDVMLSFFSNQSNAPQLDYEDLEPIDADDLNEMDLKWQVANANHTRQVPVNAAKQSSPRAATSISTARPVNTAAPKPKVNDALPITYSYFKAHSPLVLLREMGKMLLSPQHAGFGDQQEMRITVRSITSKIYCLVVTDDYSRFSWVFFLATKDETSGILKTFITGIENQINHKVKIIRCDNGTEFKNNDMNQFCGIKGIKREFSIARTPQQNGVAERKNRTLIEAARTMLADSLLPTTFWAEAVSTACYVQNRVLVTKPHNKTPYELLHGSGPDWLFDIDLLTNSMNYEPSSEDAVVDDAGKNTNKEPANEGERNGQEKEEGASNKEGESFTKCYELPTNPLMLIYRILLICLNNVSLVVQMMMKMRVAEADLNNLETTVKVNPKLDRGHCKIVATSLVAKGLEIVDLPQRQHAIRTKEVYVDDIIFGSTKKSLCTEFESLMHKKFQMSSMGELTFFLGLQVMQRDDGIFISQDKYVADILKKFDFVTMKTASTPIETNKELLKDEEAEDVDVHLYRLMIRSLMYLTTSRPDIMFVVCACARFQVTLKVSHLHAMKRIFRYLKGQPKLGLWYPRDSPFDLEAFLDSGYAGASLDKKSTTGGCQFLGKRLISWQRKKQTIVANSTIEAEYVAANCYGQVLWIQNQMLDYGFNFMNTKIYIDNESAICIVKNLVFHSKTKHIEIRRHFIKDSYEKKLIQVIKIHTNHNVADLLTKAFDVGDEAVHKELDDKMERTATTTSSLEAEQDSGNINRTQSMATLNESFPQGTDSGNGPRCQDTILGGAKAQTRFEVASK
ncbi:putative ribonuclease H-like domain-containing protein [Tanacetum coccineum]